MRRLYVAIALASAVIVYFANDAINRFLAESSALGAVILFIILPLAAILTRPVIVAAQRGREQRAIGVVYAIRAVRIGFFFKSFLLWALFSTIVIGSIGFAYREGALPIAAGVSNWWYLTNLAVLVVHLIPGQFRLPPAKPVTFIVAGPKHAGKSTFIGLLPLEEMPRDWSVMPSDNARRLLLNLHARAKGDTEIETTSGTPRLTFTRPHVWSKYIGTRPIPIDFVERSNVGEIASERTGVVLIIPANAGITGEIQSRLHGKIDAPVAVVLTKSDLAPDVALPPDAAAALDQSCRKWKAFTASDRGGEPSDLEGFSPKGYLAAAMWLLGGIR